MNENPKLSSIHAGGFSATVDAYAHDDEGGLHFLSMVGSQTALKAVWGNLLKQPPETAHLIEGADGMALTGNFVQVHVAPSTIGTWTTNIARIPRTLGWHAFVHTKIAHFAFDERQDFTILANSEEQAVEMHYRFLNRKSPLPMLPEWGQRLWNKGLRDGQVKPLTSQGILAYHCSPNYAWLREDIEEDIRRGKLPTGREND